MVGLNSYSVLPSHASIPLLFGVFGFIITALGFVFHYHLMQPIKRHETASCTEYIVNSESEVLERGMTVSNVCPATQHDVVGLYTPLATEQHTTRLPLSYDPMCGPSPRIGCAMAIDNSTGIVVIGGGLGSETNSTGVSAYSSCSDTWITLSENGICLMYARMVVSSNSRVYLIGGINDKAEVSSAVYGYDFDGKEWVLSDVAGSHQPPGRFNFSLTKVCEDHFVLFGGRGSDGVLYNDIWSMKISEYGLIIWERMDERCSLPVPAPREAHAAVLKNDLMMLFGGCSDGEGVCNNNIINVFDMKICEWVLKDTVGDVPSMDCLVGGSAHLMGEGSDIILVIAGIPCPDDYIHSPHGDTERSSDSGGYVSGTFNSLFTLDMRTEPYVWERVSADWLGGGDPTFPPTSRCFYGSALDTDSGLLYIFGGLDNGAEEVVALGGLCILDCSRLMRSIATSVGAEDGEQNDTVVQVADGEDFIYDNSSAIHCDTDIIDPAVHGREIIECESTATDLGTCSVAPLACPIKPSYLRTSPAI